MCRHLAYWGPPISPAALALDGPHALIRQCTDAREMSWGRDNLDGWGFAWQTGSDPVGVHRSSTALVDDGQGRARMRETTAERFMVHVRQKTPGSATDAVNSAPFTDGEGRLFTHNGYVEGFRDGVREQLLAKVAPHRVAGIRGDTDSEVLFALVLSRLDDGLPATEAIRAVADVAELYGGRYNVLLWADDTITATRWENSLYLRCDRAATVSSEPLDEGPWRPVAERSLVVLTGDGVRLEGL